jgi:SPP1 gp7 family putative phage head morphogenesis protein
LLVSDSSLTNDSKEKTKETIGKQMSLPLGLEQTAAARAAREFQAIRSATVEYFREHETITSAGQLLKGLRGKLESVTSAREQREFVVRQVAEVSRFNAGQVSKSVGVQVPELMSARVKYALTKQALKGVRGVPREVVEHLAPDVHRAIETGDRGATFSSAIADKLRISEARARKVAVGTVIRANSALTEQRHKALGITEYIWRSSPDKHTRKWHRKLNSQRCSYDDEPMGGGGGPYDTGHPGSADRCRCQAIPVIPATLKTPRAAVAASR